MTLPRTRNDRGVLVLRYDLLKRAVDLGGSILGLSLLWPVFLFVAIAIKRDDGGRVFFRQTRIGRDGEPFRIWKFRTMHEAENIGGSKLTRRGDPRITRVGRILRQTKLDELPQLLNVVAGEMSLVGPRPEVPEYVALLTEDEREILDRQPGITDPASRLFRDEGALLADAEDPEALYVSTILPKKIKLNLEYARSATVWTDILEVTKTILAIVGVERARVGNSKAE